MINYLRQLSFVLLLLNSYPALFANETPVKASKSSSLTSPEVLITKPYEKEGPHFTGFGDVVYTNFFGQSAGVTNWPSRTVGPNTYRADRLTLRQFGLGGGFRKGKYVANGALAIQNTSRPAVYFAYLDMLFHERANLRAGLFLMPMGLYHEAITPTAIQGTHRPEVEELIIPGIWRESGLMLFGKLGAGFDQKLGVTGGLEGEGLRQKNWIRDGRTQGGDAFADNLAAFWRIDYRTSNLLSGVSIYHGGMNYAPSNFGAKRKYDRRLQNGRATLLEAHTEIEFGRSLVRGLFAFGQIGGIDKVNQVSGQNLGRQVLGGYIEYAYDAGQVWGGHSQLFVPFLRLESYDLNFKVATSEKPNQNLSRILITTGADVKPEDFLVLKFSYSYLAWRRNKGEPNSRDRGKHEFSLSAGFVF